MPIPNPNNDYVPKIGDLVRVIGACHPRALGKVCEVIDIKEGYYESKWKSHVHGTLFSCGDLGGLEPAVGSEIDYIDGE